MRVVTAVASFVSVLALSPAALPAQTDPQALQRMVASERAFAAATAEVGVRDGFLAFFADDAIQIARSETAVTLGKARDGLASQPLQQLPIPNQLIWEPFTGQVSADGSMGWLTGGYVRFNQAQKTTVGQGAYFSVWKRQSNGTWRVWLDEGIQLPQIWQNASPFRVAPEPEAGIAGAAKETVEAAEAQISMSAQPYFATWQARASANVRLHVNGQMPFVGRDAAVAWLRDNRAQPCAVIQTEVAPSNDLGVVVGGCRGRGKTFGSFVRVWKRDAGGRWRIVFETQNGL